MKSKPKLLKGVLLYTFVWLLSAFSQMATPNAFALTDNYKHAINKWTLNDVFAINNPSDDCWPDWEPGRAYNGGAQVSHNGINYRAKWWTNGEPGIDDTWESKGPCGDGVPTLSADAGGPYSAIKGSSVSFSGSASGGTTPYTYSWNFGDGSTGAGNNASHTYNTEGNYTATLTVTDNSSQSATSTSSVTITAEDNPPGGDCNGLPNYPEGRGSYAAGQQVANNGSIYQVKEWPFTGWANSSSPAYEPGVGYAWQDAWSYVGECGGSDPTGPAAPSSLTVKAASNQIDLKWNDNADNEDNFALEVAVNYGTWSSLANLPANTTSYTHSGLSDNTTYSYRISASNTEGQSDWSNTASATIGGVISPSDIRLVGYWHNFSNGSTDIRLRDVSDSWDVVNVAFGETAGDRCTLSFSPYNCTEDEFKSDVAYLKSKGKKVVLSIGGQNGVLIVSDAAARNTFVQTAIALIENYGFSGIDLDLENNVTVNSGETIDNPTNPQIINLISATREICNHFGADFILSMAPEIAYVQGGITAYGGPWGGYLPIIHNLRDKLTYLHVQHYNCGGNAALDGKTYNQGTADFEVAMAEMLMKGFPIAGNSSNMFPALRQDQVMIGLPAKPGAAPSGGYISPSEMKKALDYLIKGVSYGGSYQLQGSSYPDFKGLMTWSINWDLTNGSEFVNNYRPYFDNLSVLKSTAKQAKATTGCWPEWEQGRAYVGGEMVSHNSINYKAKWWTNGEPGVDATWASQGPCGDNPSDLTASAGDTYSAKVGVAINFNGSASGGTAPYTFSWNFGDGSTASGSNPVHSYSTQGNYTATLNVTDNSGILATSAAGVTITSDGGSTGDCNGLPDYPEGLGNYIAGQQVSNNGEIYEVKPWPFTGWANSSSPAYVPGEGYAWQDAWIYVGSCGDGNPTGPEAPSSLTATASSNQITLQWTDNSSDEDNFIVEVAENNGAWSSLATLSANTISYIHTGLSDGTYSYRVSASNTVGQSDWSNTSSTTIGTPPELGNRYLVGYWHTWGGGVPFVKLRDVNPQWDVINVSFAEPVSAGSTDGRMKFVVSGLTSDYTIDDFKADINTLKSQGKKVVLSIGGYEGYFSLTSSAAVNQFVSDIKGFVNEYGFDGIDIDLEQSSVTFNAGADPDFKNPTSPKVVNMISAIRQICNAYDSDFILSWAPETFYLQLGYQFYGGINASVDSRAGVYIPMIHALRDKTTYVHAQLYNSIAIQAPDGKSYSMGNSEAIVAMCKMLLDGFNVNKDSNHFFPPLRADQVVIGVPASAGAAGSGQVTNAQIQSAFSTLDAQYPGLRGIMTWSINWDVLQNNSGFANSNGAFLHGLKSTENNSLDTNSSKTTVTEENTLLSNSFSVNYPNPFQLTTTISYSLPAESMVILKVFDMMGKLVATLVNGMQSAGRHKVVFDGTELPAGFYMYRLQTGNHNETRKIMHVK